MGFVAPLMLLGMISVAIPLAIHLIGKRRAKVVRFAAVDFLLGSDRKVSRWLRLREVLLLCARVLVCAVIPLAFAQPFLRCDAPGLPATRGPQAAVLIVDNSAISAYQLDGETLLAREKRKAGGILSLLGPEAEVAIFAAAGGQTPIRLVPMSDKVAREVTAIRESCRGARMDVSLERAYRLLSGAAHEKRTVFVLAPLAAAGFSASPPPPPAGIEVVTLDPAAGAALPNLAVTDITTAPASEVGPRGIAVTARVANYTAREQTRAVKLTIAGTIIARGTLTVAAHGTATKRFSAVLPPDRGPTPVSVTLDGDHLSLDDTRFTVAAAGQRPRVLLVNGAPRTTRHEDELFYLTVALAPSGANKGGADATVTTPDLLATTELLQFDAVVLANVRALPEAVVTALVRYVSHGGGLFITAGDNLDPTAYGRTMTPLLPAPLATVRDVARASGGTASTSITDMDIDHPVMSVVAGGQGGLTDAAFSKLMLLSPGQKAGSRVLARYASGAPALIAGRIGKGRTLLATFTIDRDWTNLPIYPAYVAMMRRAIRYLAGQEAAERTVHEITCGEPAILPTLPSDARLAIDPPTGERIILDRAKLAGRSEVAFRQTLALGTYRVFGAPDDGDFVPRLPATFVANVDPRLSDTSRIAPGTLTRGHTANARVRPFRERRVGISQYLALAVLGLIAIEAIFLLRT